MAEWEDIRTHALDEFLNNEEMLLKMSQLNGIFNEEIFKSAIADWRANDPLRYDAWLQDEKAIIEAAKERLYFNLIKGGVDGEFISKLLEDLLHDWRGRAGRRRQGRDRAGVGEWGDRCSSQHDDEHKWGWCILPHEIN